MASIAFPSVAKKATLSDGTTYGYVAIPPSATSKITFLLLHGYPSSCFDWRHQIYALKDAGYGVIAPDLLGYGDSDKPSGLEAYRMKIMSSHIAEILDIENVPRCVAVAHDWGVGLISRLATYERDRLYGIITVSVSYVEPGLEWDIDAFSKLTEELFGYATYGYWKWHNTEDAVKDCNEHPASVFSLVYPTDPLLWKTDFGPTGRAAEFVRAGKRTVLPPWYTLDEYNVRERIFANGGYRGPLSWYKAAMQGINDVDEAAISENEKPCSLPTLLVVSEQDYVTRADMQTAKSKEWVPQLQIETLNCGHWIQLERPNELFQLLDRFAWQVTASASASTYAVHGSTVHGSTRGVDEPVNTENPGAFQTEVPLSA